jgi:Cu+-exporting ATPase
MRQQTSWSMALAAVALLGLATIGRATDPAATVITIGDLECQGCAKKVTAKLNEVPGVAAVQADVQAKPATITPKAQTALSPRALWEAVEKAGKTPMKLEGPNGKFTAKPRS